MVYHRPGRPTLYFQAVLPAARFKELSTGTSRRALANLIVAMWESLARDHRAWDLLDPVVKGERPIGDLYDLWTSSGQSPRVMRARLEDVNVVDFVDEWVKVYRSGVAADSAAHALAHVRALLPGGLVAPRSFVTTEWLTRKLAAYPGAQNTRRKVHSNWSMFFEYCTRVRGLFEVNPMTLVDRPRQVKPPIRFYELDDIERIVEAQPRDPAALMALLYGTGIEVSVALTLTRSKVALGTQEITTHGTKAHQRNRVCRVDDWAWPRIKKYVRGLLPQARLFPDYWNRWTVSDWHRETVIHLDLAERLPLKNARHSWAVRNLRAGVPIHVVQAQLGHGTAKLTLDTYGAWIPSGVDRVAAGKQVTAHERKRRGKR